VVAGFQVSINGRFWVSTEAYFKCFSGERISAEPNENRLGGIHMDGTSERGARSAYRRLRT